MPGWAKCQLLSTCDPLKLVSVGTCISLVYVSTCMNTLFLSYGESFLSDVRGAFLFVLSYLFPLPPRKLVGKAKLLAVASADLLDISEYCLGHWALGSFA